MAIRSRPRAPLLDTREQLLHLLAEAAELEHNLLCCYLYAAFSLKRADDASLDAEERRAIERWRSAVTSVAIEEMTHLALVANLTVAIGVRPHFDRPNLPVPPGYHPSGIVVELAPFDLPTLDHFIFLERPEGLEIADGEGFEPDVEYERGARPGAALMPGAHDYDTIAEFYERIRDTLSRVCARLGERALFVGDPSLQVGPDVVELEGLSTIDSLESALAALDTIVVQGEGSRERADDSHFARFQSIRSEYEALLARRPDFAPARPAAKNPVMRAPIEGESRVHVDEPRAAALLDIANAVYNHMLRLLTAAWGTRRGGVAAKRQCIEQALGCMRVLSAVAEHVATLPASATSATPHAGVTFAMLRATEPFIEELDASRVIGERFEELARGLDAVAGDVAALRDAVQSLRTLGRAKPQATSASCTQTGA